MNQWNHVKIAYDTSGGGGVLRYYENGVLQLSIPNFGTDVHGFCHWARGWFGPITFLVDDVSYNTESCGDYNGDGVVNLADLIQWRRECWKPKADCGDYNGDGTVNRRDLRSGYENARYYLWMSLKGSNT